VRQALDTLPWVEHTSVDADVTTHRVRFGVKDPEKFDIEALKKALADVNFSESSLISGPEK
jgi:phosphotransferase system IIB component